MSNKIKEILKEKILVLDGAMGTQIQNFNLEPKDFGGGKYFGCNEILNETASEKIKEIHIRYLIAGANIIETNSFGAFPLTLKEYDLEEKSYELAKQSAKIARNAIDEYYDKFKIKDRCHFVAGSVGPSNKIINLTGGISFDEMKDNFKIQIQGLIDGKVDLILFETFPDTSNLKAGITAYNEVCPTNEVPFMVSVTIETNGTMLSGQTIEALYNSISHYKPLSIGMNCGFGPYEAEEYIRALSDISSTGLSAHPNAGLPNENGEYSLKPNEFADLLFGIASKGYLNIVGGCCGTTPAHIEALSKKIKNVLPRKYSQIIRTIVSGMEPFEISDEKRPVMVGERANMSGSKKFKKLIRNKEFEKGCEIAVKQVKKGAQIIDINLSDTESDELENIKAFYPELMKKIKVPIMIDSAGDAQNFEEAMKYLQGKCILNSINLEDLERTEKIIKLAQKYGALILAVLIDEEGMAISYERKLIVAEKIYNLLVVKHGFPKEDIVFDTLVFPLGSGDDSYYKAAKYSLDAIKELKFRYPFSKFSLGVSNCSFGLPPAGREVLNSVYLFEATKSGLDLAIVNSQKIVRYASLSIEEKELSSDLLYDNSSENVQKFIEFYSDKKTKSSFQKDSKIFSTEEKLKEYIVEGLKDGLTSDLDRALEKYKPLEIINTILMNAMSEVGKKFNANELTVIEVLQSAEVMKSAVNYLKQFLLDTETFNKAKIILATVKGDVHDIGKNLVEIVLSNNGYEIIDLGIKVDSKTLIKAVKEHKPDAIGLSGLLVKSALEMINTAKDLENAGISIPIYVGGAALSGNFALNKIQPNYSGLVYYGKDAVTALSLLNDTFVNKTKIKVEPEIKKVITNETKISTQNLTTVKNLEILPKPDNFKLNIVNNVTPEMLYTYMNNQMLYGHHFGIKGGYQNFLDKTDEKTLKLKEVISLAKDDIAIHNLFSTATGIYKFFKVKRENNILFIYDEDLNIIDKFEFERQSNRDNRSLIDYFEADKFDTVALAFVTTGKKIMDFSKNCKDEDRYTASHVISSLAIATAESLMEIIHFKIREDWNFSENKKISKEDMTRGCRYSPGYSAFSDLTNQTKFFNLLQISKFTDVHLSKGMMMDPENSITALVIHHPDAKYFNIDD